MIQWNILQIWLFILLRNLFQKPPQAQGRANFGLMVIVERQYAKGNRHYERLNFTLLPKIYPSFVKLELKLEKLLEITKKFHRENMSLNSNQKPR